MTVLTSVQSNKTMLRKQLPTSVNFKTFTFTAEDVRLRRLTFMETRGCGGVASTSLSRETGQHRMKKQHSLVNFYLKHLVPNRPILNRAVRLGQPPNPEHTMASMCMRLVNTPAISSLQTHARRHLLPYFFSLQSFAQHGSAHKQCLQSNTTIK